ncbi:MAG: mechanosensitive ion channel family protein [Thermoanaerobaculales bacterium]|nr:mechanosensitive ion channel family protein [Thermoanaerobaculales bacterium]
MLDLALVFFTLLVALAVRIPALHRLRDLTNPLLLTAAAAFGHLLATGLEVDPVFERAAEVTLVLALGYLVARGCLLVIFDWVLVRRMGISPPRLVREVVALVVYLVLGAILLRSLGVEVTGLIATSAVLTVVVGLALQQTLGNLLAGLALAWEQRLTIGTWIEIGGRVGVIEQTGWRSLVIRTRLDEQLLVPNSEVGGATIKILGSGAWPAAVTVRFGVAYGVAPDAVKALITGVAADIPGVLANPAPQVLTSEFADSAVVYECRMWTLSPWRREVLNDLLLTRAYQALARAGMEIPFPQRTLHRAPRRPSPDTEARRLEAIAGSALFGGLPREALEAMAGSSRILRFAPGEAVVRAGDRSTALYLVETGDAAVEINGRVIARVAAGEVFGEAAFLTGNLRTATVRAVTEALEVVELDEASLRSLLEHHPELADQLAEKMAARQRFDESLRDASGAIVSPAGMVAQLKRQLLRIVGR